MSPEHYPKLTVEASIFCKTCMKMTPWRIAGGKRQFCIPCYERDHAPKPEATAPPAEQTDFDWGGDK